MRPIKQTNHLGHTLKVSSGKLGNESDDGYPAIRMMFFQTLALRFKNFAVGTCGMHGTGIGVSFSTKFGSENQSRNYSFCNFLKYGCVYKLRGFNL